MKIYLASSWKNERQVRDLALYLRECGHEVDAFCDPSTGRYVFSFAQLPNIENMNAMTVLQHEPVQKAFAEDKAWIDWSDVVIMLLPCGKSAHLEAGYAKGSGKHLIIYQESFPAGEFDVMYGFADLVTDDWHQVVDYLKGLEGIGIVGQTDGVTDTRRVLIPIAEYEALLSVSQAALSAYKVHHEPRAVWSREENELHTALQRLEATDRDSGQ